MDDDLQHPPEEIPKLLAVLAEGFDVVYGTPQNEEHGMLRDLASIVTKMALQNVMGATIARQVSAFRAFRAEVAGAFSHYEGSFVSIDVLLTWGTNRFAATPVVHQPRKLGTSGYSFRKLITHAMNMMTGFTTLPLQIASLVGFAFTFFGILCVGLRPAPVLHPRRSRSRLPLSGFDRRSVLRRPVVCPGYHRRVSGSHAFPESAKAAVRCPIGRFASDG